MTMVVRPLDRPGRTVILVKKCAAARPSLSGFSAVTGSIFAVPRTPSVPKIFRPPLPLDSVAGLLFRGVAIATCIELKFVLRSDALFEFELKSRRRGGRFLALVDDRPQND